MKSRTIRWPYAATCAILLALLLIRSDAFADKGLSPKILDAVGSAVFEVVVPKPEKDSLAYKEPLPFDTLPYTVRNDHYFSFGTAFAIGPNLFVSAVHVMNVGLESQWGETQIRDSKGKVYAIDKIIKYSERRDFIVFTAKGCSVKKPLVANTRPRLQEKVFAVGNALGEGIVIRDGLYTSDTPESEEGAWNYLRFSAAASPGNSGGPLLDGSGKVVGIVLRKSPNENLNMALPIAEVLNAKENVAHIWENTMYSLPIMQRQKSSKHYCFLNLPKTFSEMSRELAEHYYFFRYEDSEAFFKEQQEKMFPNGAGSKALLFQNSSFKLPSLFKMKEDGFWAYQDVKATKLDIGKNGNIEYGQIGSFSALALQRPDDVTLDQLFGDGKVFMDLVLQGVNFPRTVGTTPVRITSFGEPAESYIFQDYYGRKWLVRTWLREFDDSKVATFSLPTPQGLFTLMKIGQTGAVDGITIPELKILTNFVCISYYGTLKQWQEFLEHKELLPDCVNSVKILRDDAGLSFSSGRLSMNVGNDIMPFSEKSFLGLSMGYGVEKGSATWDINGVMLVEDFSAASFLLVSRLPKPDGALSEETQAFWKNVTTRKFPYNRTAYNSEGVTRIVEVIESPESTEGKEMNLVHYISYARNGEKDYGLMEENLGKILKELKISETSEPGKMMCRPKPSACPIWNIAGSCRRIRLPR